MKLKNDNCSKKRQQKKKQKLSDRTKKYCQKKF